MMPPILTNGCFHVVIIWQRFLPYHRARLQYLSRRLSSLGYRLSALEVASHDSTYNILTGENNSISFETIFPERNYHALDPIEIRNAVLTRLQMLQPDIVFAPATAFPEGMGAISHRLGGRNISILMDDAWEHTDQTSCPTRLVKRLIHRVLDGAFIPAPSHTSYYQSLNFPAERLLFGVDVVDNDYYATHADTARANGLGIRVELDLPERYFLFVGRFLPRKGVDTLLAAYAAYRAQAEQPWDLVLVGGGPEEAALKRQARDLAGVHFAGVRTGEELCQHYGLAGALIVPSESDPWALVVNEGMAAGLPVLVSRGCGCARTLVHEGANGWSFAPGDAQELADRMLALARLPDAELKAMGQCSRKIIANWDLDRFAEGVLQALKIPRRPAAGFLSNLAVRLWKGRVRVN